MDGGERTWVQAPHRPASTPSTTTCSGSTSTATAQCELVTGKRHRAHCGNDAGEWDDLGIYYFKWTGEGFAKQVIDYGPIGDGKGCGIHFALADLRGTGRLDLVAPGKDGL